jgi:hypothetical protein
MLEILSFITGFLGPIVPQVFKWFERKQEYAHELALMELRLKQGAMEHLWKMEEINANADIAEMQTLRTPQQSFGVQLLDASKAWVEAKSWGVWIILPVFYLFAFLDFMTGMVRPVVTYCAFGFYMLYKWTLFRSLEVTSGREAAILSTWAEQDWAVLLLVLGYFFGQRTMKAVFGGSANTTKRDGGY